MNKKYIHYCWFGGKPLPKLAKKCIKSWKKYLPDFEIKKWSEENVDLNECIFIKEAYANKKWAFVADYVRAKAMYEYGGIYLDTDMEITDDITLFLLNKTFLGIEDSNMIACGVWWERENKSFISKELMEFYKNQVKFPINDMFSISIPRILTNILIKKGFQNNYNDIQILENDIYIYPREYLYPLSYDHNNNVFTEKTCMIHYYNASWTPKWEQRENKIYRYFGKKNGIKIILYLRKIKYIIRKVTMLPIYPYVLYLRKKKEKDNINSMLKKIQEDLYELKNNLYLSFYNPNWLGTAQATIELFDNTFPLTELYNDVEIKSIAKMLVDTKINTFIFSAFCVGWDKLVLEIKQLNPETTIKVLWHGSNAMHIEDYDWNMFKTIFDLLKSGNIKSIGFVKKAMYELYKSKGYNVEFVMNTIKLDSKNEKVKSKSKFVKIGLYASGDRWVKNFYNQLAAASLIENCEIDCIPLSNKIIEFGKLLNIQVNGSFTTVQREDLLERLSENDINVYATFVECAPLLPLESLETGVPCITGNNHHYWENTELEKYLIVNAVDNINEIYEKIILCLEKKAEIIELYKKWKKTYDKEVEKSLKSFIESQNMV